MPTREHGTRTTRESRKSATEVALHCFHAPGVNMKPTGPQFDALILQRMKLYQEDGLAALRDLAMMPITTNSANNMVKFMAASRLCGKPADAPPEGAGDLADYLKKLNEDFTKAAPRIKSVREREITFEDGSTKRGVTVEHEASHPLPLAAQSLPENTD